MAIEIRLPNITGATEKEQLLQLKSYLYQLSEQLQWAFDNINTTGGSGNGQYVVNQARGFTGSSGATGGSGGGISFAELKSLIIKSADIVEAYYEEINKRLEGYYVAQSDFGTYAELTSQEIEANSTAITQSFENTQTIIRETKDELSGGIDNARSELTVYIDGASSELNGAINSLDGKVGAATSELDGKITDANDRIDETNGKITNLDEAIGAANKRIDGAEDNLTEAKNELNKSIQAVSDSLSTTDKMLQSAKEELKGSLEDLEFDLAGLTQIVVDVAAYVKSGLIYYTDEGVPVYGIEIGQTVDANGQEVFNKFARFTSEKLSFYDANGNEVAYISDKKLYIGQAEITTSIKIGKLIDLVMANGDVVTKWEGGS